MKRYFVIAALLSAICVAQNLPTGQVYDAFKGPYFRQFEVAYPANLFHDAICGYNCFDQLAGLRPRHPEQ